MEGIEKNEGKKYEKSYFDVLGLCCSSEVPLIEKILDSLDGIKDFSVVVPTKTLIVVHDSLLISQIQIVKAPNESRLEASVRVLGHGSYKNKWPSPYAICCGIFLILSFLKYVYTPFRWLAIAAIVVGIPPVLLKAFAALRNFRLDINILVLITVAGSIALRDYWEAATIVFLFTISEWLESRASHKATAVMSSLVSVVPQKAVIAESGVEINADEVKLGTVLAVKAGHVIPIDGVVVEGSCEVDEKIMTGESFPVTKQKESSVWASTINLNGYISIKTTAVAEDCVVARMAKIVEEAQNKKSRTQRFLDKCAKYYTPAIVLVSASLAIVALAFHVHNKREWYHLALVVLVSGCPCALLLSTPVAMFCALSKAATLGVLFKGAQHLETLAGIKIMAFDKTGTITRGEFEVVDFRSLQPEISLNELLFWISSIECKSSHPMAAALIDFARTHSIEPKPDRVEHFHNFPGEGISGKIDNINLYIGNKKIASKAGCSTVPRLEGYDIEGKSVGYVFLGSSLVAVFCLTDVCRTGAKEAIQELNSLGIKTIMLTGDSHGAATRAQEQLGGALEVIRAELLPEDKARMIKEFQEEGSTAMIGDGLNDAPALTTADIGISMGIGGSALATETGDVVLMTNDIQRIPKALRLARRVRRKIIENMILSISTKAAIIGLAIAGHPLVWAAVLSDVGTCLLVIFNSMLLLRGTNNSESHSHIYKHSKSSSSSCCDKESQKLKPCSSKKCIDKKCSSSIKEHGHHGHGDHGLELQKPHSHGCCGMKKNSSSTKEHCHEQNEDIVEVDHDLESKKPHKHGCCGTKKSSSSTKEHCHEDIVEVAHDIESQKPHSHGCCGTKKSSSSTKEHCHEQNEDIVEVDHDLESKKPHKHGCCGTKKSSSSTKEHCHEDIVEVAHDIESQKPHSHGCCGTKKSSSSTKEHCHEQSEGIVEVDLDLESQKPPRNRGCCGTKKNSSSKKGHCHEQSENIVEVDHDLESQIPHSHGCCGTKKSSSSTKEYCHEDIIEVDRDLESQKPHSHGCCGTKKSSSSTKEHCHEQSEDIVEVHNHDLESQNQHCHVDSGGTKKCSSSKNEHHLPQKEEDGVEDHEHKHGCSTTGCKNQETQPCEKHNCSATLIDGEKSDKLCLESRCVIHDKDDDGDDEERYHCKGRRGHGVSSVSCEDSTRCNAVCTDSKKVHQHRGCCDSFMRECCIRSGHFEANLRGGLSEIVID